METSKPDLLAAAPRAAQDKRILAQLEHGPRAPAIAVRAAGWTIDGWTIGLIALLLTMCSVAWLMHDKRITPETFRQGASSSVARGATPAAKPVQASSVDDATEEAATIVNEAAPADYAATSATSPVRGGDAHGALATANKTNNTAPSPTAVTAAIANSAQPSSRATPHKPAARAAATAPPAQPSSDTDVTLLTALVAHAGTPSSVTPERSRDIVEHRDGDSTAQLLARCKQLGMIEGLLCRSRICSGRWEADAACRAPAH